MVVLLDRRCTGSFPSEDRCLKPRITTSGCPRGVSSLCPPPGSPAKTLAGWPQQEPGRGGGDMSVPTTAPSFGSGMFYPSLAPRTYWTTRDSSSSAPHGTCPRGRARVLGGGARTAAPPAGMLKKAWDKLVPAFLESWFSSQVHGRILHPSTGTLLNSQSTCGHSWLLCCSAAQACSPPLPVPSSARTWICHRSSRILATRWERKRCTMEVRSCPVSLTFTERRTTKAAH